MDNVPTDIPKEAKEKFEAIKAKVEKFKDALLERFEEYLTGVALLPPPKPEEGKQPDDSVNVLVLVDDSDSMKPNKLELKEKIEKNVSKIAAKTDKKIVPQVVIHAEIWQSCFDAKYDIIQMIAISAPVHDKGIIAGVKISEIHKSMVLKKFEKYIVSYVLSGSLVRGEATETSDIDVMVIIDDTDVKKMTRAELKDKLRAIIIGMGIEAGEMTGIRNKLNIQVYILTDFWDSLKEANPVIFTLLRDGIPFYDRGTFMPWKHLLKMGKIKPSQEAIDMFMGSGDQLLKRVELKIKEIGMEDIYYAILTPSQAALMLYGMPPPAPRETPRLMQEVFVKKEGILEEKYVKILGDTIKVRKDLEHGAMEKISGKQVDTLLNNANKYLKRISRLFKQIEEKREKDIIVSYYDDVITVTRDVMRLCGVDKSSDKTIVEDFNDSVVCSGEVPQKYLRILKSVIRAKESFDKGKLSKSDIERIKKNSKEYIKFMVEHVQRKRGAELERAKIRVKYGDKFGELYLLDKIAYIIHDIDDTTKEVSKAKITSKGSLSNITKSSLEEMEKDIAKIKIPEKVFVKQPVFDDMKKLFGKDVEVLLTY